MPGESFSEYDVIKRIVEAELADVFVSRPAKVTAFDPLTNTAFVKPSTKRALYKQSGERIYEELPEIPFVPVIFPSGGGLSLRFPLEPGDTVLLIFSDTSLAEWRGGEDPAEPVDAREHSIGWPVAFAGFYPDTKVWPPLDGAELAAGGAVLGDENSTAKMIIGGTVPGIRFGQLALSPIALGVPTDAAIVTIMTTLTAIIVSLNALITKYNAHQHTGVTTGGGTSGTTTQTASAAAAAPGAPGTTQSTLVKSL